MVDLCRELIFKQENVWLLYLILNDANDNQIEMIVEVKYANERQMDKSVKVSLKKNNRRFFSKEQRAAYGEKSDMKKSPYQQDVPVDMEIFNSDFTYLKNCGKYSLCASRSSSTTIFASSSLGQSGFKFRAATARFLSPLTAASIVIRSNALIMCT